jgi:DNA polymerase-3 subunit epsilon
MTSKYSSTLTYPPKISFGKYKGRFFQEANEDDRLLAWIQQLSHSPNPKSADIGKWYLSRLGDDSSDRLVVYLSPKSKDLHGLIANARETLAGLDAIYTQEHQAVDSMRSTLFMLLRESYEKRDDLLIKIEYRRRFLEALLRNDDEAAESAAREEQQASQKNHQSYKDAANQASDKHVLNEKEQIELREIYRKLATLYHPDRYAGDASKQEAYAELMKLINQAKDACAIDILREIAKDPGQYLAAHGYEDLNLQDESALEDLQLLYEMLLKKIEQSQKLLDDLRANSDYELWILSEKDPEFLDAIAADQRRDLEKEIERLDEECTDLSSRINNLLDPDSPYRL